MNFLYKNRFNILAIIIVIAAVPFSLLLPVVLAIAILLWKIIKFLRKRSVRTVEVYHA